MHKLNFRLVSRVVLSHVTSGTMLFVVIVVLLPFVCCFNLLGFTIGYNMGVYLFSYEQPN